MDIKLTPEHLPLLGEKIRHAEAEVEDARHQYHFVKTGSLGPRYHKLWKEAENQLAVLVAARDGIIRAYRLKR